MAIGGEKRKEFSKRVGLFEARVVAINPTVEEFEEVLGIEIKEESKAAEYSGETRDGEIYSRVSVWLQDIKNETYFSVNYMLINRERENKEMTKKQYINSSGTSTWADSPNNLPDWFTEGREYRVAMIGEAELYILLQFWLNGLNYRSKETILEVNWKKLINGDVSELREQIDGEWAGTFVALATVSIKEKDDGEIVEYQSVYNKEFIPFYNLKYFRLNDYDDEKVRKVIEAKDPKKRKGYEKFVLDIYGDYGCKDFFKLKDIKDYDPSDTITSGKEIIKEDDPSY